MRKREGVKRKEKKKERKKEKEKEGKKERKKERKKEKNIFFAFGTQLDCLSFFRDHIFSRVGLHPVR